jgi:hypothetical protein
MRVEVNDHVSRDGQHIPGRGRWPRPRVWSVR